MFLCPESLPRLTWPSGRFSTASTTRGRTSHSNPGLWLCKRKRMAVPAPGTPVRLRTSPWKRPNPAGNSASPRHRTKTGTKPGTPSCRVMPESAPITGSCGRISSFRCRRPPCCVATPTPAAGELWTQNRASPACRSSCTHNPRNRGRATASSPVPFLPVHDRDPRTRPLRRRDLAGPGAPAPQGLVSNH